MTAFDTLRMLFVEQTTADEVIVFLVSCILLAFLCAFILYGMILVVLWRVQLREVTTLRALFFPSRGQFGRYLGEYMLAGSTSLLLTLTVAARHDAVQTVLEYPLYEVDSASIRDAFPFGDVGVEELAQDGMGEALAGSLAALARGEVVGPEADGLSSLGVEALLLPSVAAGGADNAALWLRVLVGRLEENPWQRFPADTHLLTLSIMLLLAYVGWFALGRSRVLAKTKGAAETDYAKIAGRLLVPAVCTALLLVSAASAADLDRITRSAVAAAGVGMDADEARAAMLFQAAMSSQIERGRLIRHLVSGTDSLPGTLQAIDRLDHSVREVQATTEELALIDMDARRQIAEVRLEIGALDTELATLSTRFESEASAAAGELARIDQQSAAITASLAAIESRMAAVAAEAAAANARAAEAAEEAESADQRSQALARRLQALAEQLPSNGLLLVTSPEIGYQVRRSPQGPAVASGASIGLHALPPADYVVTSPLGARRVTIAVGNASTLRLERVIETPNQPILR